MVANLSAHKRGWDDRWEYFSDWAVKGQAYKNKLLWLVDEDTNAFNKIVDSFRMPKGTDEEKKRKAVALEKATQYATEIPFQVMETAFNSMEVMEEMAKHGLQNSLSDAGVGMLSAKTAVIGAYFNVMINAKDLKERNFAEDILTRAKSIYDKTLLREEKLTNDIFSKLTK
jgi:glutamate formiminotransferase/formiminotetrahydrofolate cyclodeaminase